MRFRTAFLLLLLGTPFLLGDQPAPLLAPRERGPADPEQPFITIAQFDQAPTIDGKIDDAVWKQAEVSRQFVDEYAFPAAVQTTFQIGQKDDVLYFAVRAAYDPAKLPKEPPFNTKVRDGDLWQGEEIEIFLDFDNDETPGYYQLGLTPHGITGDWFCPEPKDPEGQWEPKYDVKLNWTPTEWTAEWALPLKEFNRTKTFYENFGLNVFRLHQGTASWAVLRGEGLHFPHRFGEARGLKRADVKKNEPGKFRMPWTKVNHRLIQAKASNTLVPEKPPTLVGKPLVKASKQAVDISFQVNTLTDVAVWIEDEKGERVRHLAAGKLGGNPPEPFVKNSLKQKLTWDYLNDEGKRVPPGGYQVKVGVGSTAKLDRTLGWDPTPKEIQGIAVDAKGNLVVVGGIRDEWTEVQKFDKNGNFVQMVYPPSSKIPAEKLKGMSILDFGPDGQVRVGGHRTAAYLPNLDMPMPHTPLVNSKGQIIIYGGEYLGGPCRFYKLNVDGSLPDDFLGPYVKEFTWQQYFDAWAKRFHFALDPMDENTIYLSGIKELHRSEYGDEGALKRETYYNAVLRLRWDKDTALEVAVGKRTPFGREGSKEPGQFQDPQGICFDGKGNLWVCDRGNDRVQIFDRQGKLLGFFAHTQPYEIRVNRKGEAYVFSSRPPMVAAGAKPDPKATGTMIVTKYAGVKLTGGLSEPIKVIDAAVVGPAYKGHDVKNSSYWYTMTLDDSGAKPILYVVRGDNTHPYQIHGFEDQGKTLSEGKVVVGLEKPKEYKKLAVGWDNDLVWAGGSWFDGNSGESLGQSGHGEVAAARNGTWASYGGFYPEAITIFPADWPRKPTAPAIKNWRLDPPALARAGSRGFCVAPNGDIYVARYYQWQGQYSGRAGMEGPDLHVAVDRYSPEGKLTKQRVVYELSHAAAGPAVDVKGNIYVTDNVGRKLGQFYEDDISANLPTWVQDHQVDWEKLRRGEPVAVGYMKFVKNPLIRSVGTLYKFGPEGGGLIWRAAQGEYKQFMPEPDPKNPTGGKYLDWGFPSTPKPNRPATHWSATWVGVDRMPGMYPRWQEGVKWEFLGVSPIWGRYDKGHSGCCCGNMRFAVDDFGRTFAPAAHWSTVRMLDTNGNEVLRIGRWGNMDSYGPTSPNPEPNIPLMYPSATALSKRFLYITEWRHSRILRVKLGYEAEHGSAVKVGKG